MLSQNVAAAAALITAIVLAIQLRMIAVRARQARVALAQRISEGWGALESDWNIAHMIVAGSLGYYPLTSRESRVAYREVMDAWTDAGNRSHQFAINDKKLEKLLETGAKRIADGDSEWEVAFVEELETALWRNLTRWLPLLEENRLAWSDASQYLISIRHILGFLAEVSGQILRGEISPHLVYETLGPQIARNGGAIHKMMSSAQEWTSLQPGLQLRVAAFIDLMWAEGVRIGELDTLPNAEEVAAHKKTTGSGRASRKRVKLLVQRVSSKHWLLKRWKAQQLTHLLRHAEHPAEILDAPLKYQPFEAEQNDDFKMGWDLREGESAGPKVGWMQTVINNSLSEDQNGSAIHALKVIKHLVSLRDRKGDSYNWWEEE